MTAKEALEVITLTGTDIVKLLETNDKAVCRALVVLNQRQTTEEQHAQATRVHNMRGFRPCHARMGTSMAEQYNAKGYLSPKQIAYWRVPMKKGGMRIAIYWKQLLAEAHAKAAAQNKSYDQPGHHGAQEDPIGESERLKAEHDRNLAAQTDDSLLHIDQVELMMQEAEFIADHEQTVREEQMKAAAKWTKEQLATIERVRSRTTKRR